MTEPAGAAPRSVGLAIAGAAVAGAGLLALAASLAIPEGRGYASVGPRAFPIAISAATALLGLGLLLRASVWPDRALRERVAAEARATHWPTPAAVVVALLLYALLLRPLGYLLATAPFFAGVAWALGDARPLRALGVGALLALATYLLFTRLLGVSLPAGLTGMLL